jgi:hypothetical protein
MSEPLSIDISTPQNAIRPNRWHQTQNPLFGQADSAPGQKCSRTPRSEPSKESRTVCPAKRASNNRRNSKEHCTNRISKATARLNVITPPPRSSSRSSKFITLSETTYHFPLFISFTAFLKASLSRKRANELSFIGSGRRSPLIMLSLSL